MPEETSQTEAQRKEGGGARVTEGTEAQRKEGEGARVTEGTAREGL